jgi:hypothetical protein
MCKLTKSTTFAALNLAGLGRRCHGGRSTRGWSVVVFRAANGGGVDAADRVDVVTRGVGTVARDAEVGDLQVERPVE